MGFFGPGQLGGGGFWGPPSPTEELKAGFPEKKKKEKKEKKERGHINADITEKDQVANLD